MVQKLTFRLNFAAEKVQLLAKKLSKLSGGLTLPGPAGTYDVQLTTILRFSSRLGRVPSPQILS